MITETLAIILHCRKYKENASILTAYTEKFGRASYILFGAGSKKKGKNLAMLQPLSIVSIVAEHKPNKELQVIKEISVAENLAGITANPYKSAVALFMAECLYLALKAEEQDKPLFMFIHNSILILDTYSKSISNFHITFLIKLSIFLGFSPDYSEIKLTSRSMGTAYFDLIQATQSQHKPMHNNYLTKEDCATLTKLLRMNFANMSFFRFSRQERRELLSQTLNYFKIHLHGFSEPKSLSVMQEIFD